MTYASDSSTKEDENVEIQVFVAHLVNFTFKHGIAWIGYGLEAWREFCEDFLLYH